MCFKRKGRGSRRGAVTVIEGRKSKIRGQSERRSSIELSSSKGRDVWEVRESEAGEGLEVREVRYKEIAT